MEAGEDAPHPARVREETAACIVSVKGLKDNWQRWSKEHQEYQNHNPFSHDSRPRVSAPPRGQGDYGRPPQGSMTEQRGREAQAHVGREVEELCEAIKNVGRPGDNDGSDGRVFTVEFGELFERYATISNKLVGLLLRARRQGLLHFEGEMLWQGKDDHAVITLTPSQVYQVDE
ncbi:Actin-binding Rho-activating protein [Liparis tanakae]|uniref:Actin-binding Rho-activating protein n=1 Tax=Liparis tanakae TaxID=230148 RepID=A0A4Z2F2P4_9TELE|nr:Actin-binding Rho-activating protein [Liparis tanakae]